MVTSESSAVADASPVLEALDLLAKLVNNWENAAFKLDCTPDEVPDELARLLNSWLSVESFTSVFNADTVEDTDGAGAGAATLAAWEDPERAPVDIINSTRDS